LFFFLPGRQALAAGFFIFFFLETEECYFLLAQKVTKDAPGPPSMSAFAQRALIGAVPRRSLVLSIAGKNTSPSPVPQGGIPRSKAELCTKFFAPLSFKKAGVWKSRWKMCTFHTSYLFL